MHLRVAYRYPILLFNFAIRQYSPAAAIPLFVLRGGGPRTTSVREMVSTAGAGASSSCKSPSKGGRKDDFAIGGGAINEKERLYMKEGATDAIVTLSAPDDDDASTTHLEASSSYDPNSLSHSLHASVGLDRYPNYLSRWSFDDMDQLERSLERQLREVREQKQSIRERRDGIALLVKRLIEQEKKAESEDDLTSILEPPTSWEDIRDNILDPRASEAILKSKMFRNIFNSRSKSSAKQGQKRPADTSPSVEAVLNGRISVQLDPAQLELWMEQEMFDVYSFELLSTDFCEKVRTLIQKIVSLGEQEEFRHLNLGRRPVDLDTVGLGWINDLLFHLIVRPLSQHLFTETEEFQDLDWRQGYVAGYSVMPSAPAATPRQRLVSHTDDSEVTLNVGLGDDFEGGALQFRGLRGTDEEGELLGEFKPRLGTALLHAGRHNHAVTPVTSGNRYAFIIWARSWKSLRANTCPCCWLNRRQGSTCVCGPRWN